jgi:hypothetical protein
MTIGQEDILKFVETVYPGTSADIVGESIIRVTDIFGKQTDYTMNIFGDIMEVLPNGKNNIIAVSDLPHNLDKMPLNARPTSWTKKV